MNLGGKQEVGMKARIESECFPHTKAVSEPSLIISTTEAEPQHLWNLIQRIDPGCSQQSGRSNQHFPGIRARHFLRKFISRWMFKPKQTWTYLMYFILIDLKSVGIYLRLVCGLYTTLDLVLTKKFICFRSFCNQDSREPDLLRVPCLFVSVSWLLCHCVIFLWMLVSPSVKWQPSARCCLKPLLSAGPSA